MSAQAHTHFPFLVKRTIVITLMGTFSCIWWPHALITTNHNLYQSPGTGTHRGVIPPVNFQKKLSSLNLH